MEEIILSDGENHGFRFKVRDKLVKEIKRKKKEN